MPREARSLSPRIDTKLPHACGQTVVRRLEPGRFFAVVDAGGRFQAGDAKDRFHDRFVCHFGKVLSFGVEVVAAGCSQHPVAAHMWISLFQGLQFAGTGDMYIFVLTLSIG